MENRPMTIAEQIAYDKIKPAIENQTMIKFWYKSKADQTGYFREVRPIDIYESKLGNMALSAWYKPHGIYAIGKEEGLRTYLLKDMSMIEIIENS